MPKLGDDPSTRDASYEGGDFEEVTDRKGMMHVETTTTYIGRHESCLCHHFCIMPASFDTDKSHGEKTTSAHSTSTYVSNVELLESEITP